MGSLAQLESSEMCGRQDERDQRADFPGRRTANIMTIAELYSMQLSSAVQPTVPTYDLPKAACIIAEY